MPHLLAQLFLQVGQQLLNQLRMQFLVQFFLSLGEQRLVVDGVVFKYHSVEDDGGSLHVVLKPLQPRLYVYLLGLWYVDGLVPVGRHDIIVNGLGHLLSEQDEVLHRVLHIIALEDEDITQEGPFAFSLCHVGMGRQDGHLFQIAVKILLKAGILCQQQTGRHITGISREDTLGHMEAQQGEQIIRLYLFPGMNAIDVVGSDECHALLLKLHLVVTESYRQIVFVAEKHRYGHLYVLVGIDHSS